MLNVYHLGLSEIQREAGFEQLFDTIFVFENYPLDRSLLTRSFAGLRISDVEMRDGAHYPLALMVAPDDRLRVRLDHDPARFTAEEAARIGSRFIRLLESAVAQPDVPWRQLDLFMDGERRAVLEEFNNTSLPLPATTMAEIFEKRAARAPQAIAVVQGERSISYGELDQRANRLAHFLMDKGVGPESLVGVSVERSVDMVAAIIAIWKAGAAYLPLDSDYPRARLEHMLKDAMPKLVLTKSKLQLQLPQIVGVEFFALDAPGFSSDLERASESKSKLQGFSSACGLCDLYLGIYRCSERCGGYAPGNSFIGRQSGGTAQADRRVTHPSVRFSEFRCFLLGISDGAKRRRNAGPAGTTARRSSVVRPSCFSERNSCLTTRSRAREPGRI